ncbi:hypothetical protein BDV97DRAFT_157686 [Delphinella strobiligena]|nr:hypothetical protein BDV97DRAFT_157686 [Delphinella strobiligena]
MSYELYRGCYKHNEHLPYGVYLLTYGSGASVSRRLAHRSRNRLRGHQRVFRKTSRTPRHLASPPSPQTLQLAPLGPEHLCIRVRRVRWGCVLVFRKLRALHISLLIVYFAFVLYCNQNYYKPRASCISCLFSSLIKY